MRRPPRPPANTQELGAVAEKRSARPDTALADLIAPIADLDVPELSHRRKLTTVIDAAAAVPTSGTVTPASAGERAPDL